MTTRRKTGSARTIMLAGAVLAGLTATPAFAGNILQELHREGRFATLLAAIDAAGLRSTLAGCTTCTLFAPNDTAFRNLAAGTVAALLRPKSVDKLAAILAYHAVGSAIPSSAVPAHPIMVETLNASGAKLRAGRDGGRVEINGVRAGELDIRANGSVIHEVTEVLWPGEIRK